MQVTLIDTTGLAASFDSGDRHRNAFKVCVPIVSGPKHTQRKVKDFLSKKYLRGRFPSILALL